MVFVQVVQKNFSPVLHLSWSALFYPLSNVHDVQIIFRRITSNGTSTRSIGTMNGDGRTGEYTYR
jgi:hypothetical protein